MKKLAHVFTLSLMLLAAASIAQCQAGIQYEPCPDTTGASLGCELIAWTMLQEPSPTPDTWSLPNQDRAQSTSPQMVNASNLQGDRNGSVRTTVATFTMVGVIVKRSYGYFLKLAANTLLELDNPAMAERFEGRRVRITGVRVAGINAFHLQSIDPD